MFSPSSSTDHVTIKTCAGSVELVHLWTAVKYAKYLPIK